MRAPFGLLFVALAVLTAGAFTGCERVDYIELNPADITFKQLNNEQYLEAKLMARNGVRAVAAPEWSVKDPSIAKVTARGLVTPVGEGETEVIARHGSVEAHVPVHVILVSRVEVSPTSLTIKEGQEAVKVDVKAFTRSGKLLTDRSASLNAKNKTVAQIVGNGAILPLDPGETEVEVLVDGVKTTLKVTVEKDKTKK